IIYGWIFGIDRGEAEAHQGAHLRIPRFVQYLLKYVVPLYLGLIFIAFCYQSVPGYLETLRTDGVVRMSVVFLFGVTGLLLVLVHLAGENWIREGRFDYLNESDSVTPDPQTESSP
ncbi:MAG: sodium:calcium symporter, partial [Planctomycetota bacterium]